MHGNRGQFPMKAFRVVACAAVCVAILVAADLRRGSVAAAPRPNPEKELEGGGAVHPGPPITDAEWSEIAKWMAENCPNQMTFVQKLEDTKGGPKEHARQLIAERYRAWKRAADPAMAKAMLAQIRAHDQIFGIQIKYREARGDRPLRMKLRQEMRAAVAELIEAQLDEKSARIAKLKDDVDRMKSNKETIADQYTNGMLREVGGRVRGPATNDTSGIPNTSPSAELP